MQIVKNSVIYLGSSILSKSIPFLLLPILTKYLSPAEYGNLSIFLIFISIYGAFVGMALHTNIAKNYYKVVQTLNIDRERFYRQSQIKNERRNRTLNVPHYIDHVLFTFQGQFVISDFFNKYFEI